MASSAITVEPRDTLLYSALPKPCIAFTGGIQNCILAGVAEKLPYLVLLGTDIPELGTPLSGNAKSESP